MAYAFITTIGSSNFSVLTDGENITVELLGGGEGANNGTTSGIGGSYSKSVISYVSGTSIPVVVGAGGAGGNPPLIGGDTKWNTNVIVAPGGGSATTQVGTFKSTGGSYGGGAAGPNGNGNSGNASVGGSGDNGYGGTGGLLEGNGGNGTEWDATHGSGGGGGPGQNGNTGGNGGLYGGGGGIAASPNPVGGSGGQGLIVVTYNSPPSASSISPSSAVLNSSGFTMDIYGTGFISGSTVYFNGSSRATTYVNSTHVQASILSTDLTITGTYTITVLNASGGTASNAIIFMVNNPVAIITAFSPPSSSIYALGFTLTINGTGFVPGSVAYFNGYSLPTTYISWTQITAVISEQYLVDKGIFPFTVINPAPGGGTSLTYTYSVQPFMYFSSMYGENIYGVLEYAGRIGQNPLISSYTDLLAFITVAQQQSSQQNAFLTVSNYAWLSQELITTQQQFTITPFSRVLIIDNRIMGNQIILGGGVYPYRCFDSSAWTSAPDGSLCGADIINSGGNTEVVFYNIQGQFNSPLSSCPVPYTVVTSASIPNIAFEYPAISCSQFYNGTYIIDIAFWVVSESNLISYIYRSYNGGTAWNEVSVGASVTSNNHGISTIKLGTPKKEPNGYWENIIFYVNGARSGASNQIQYNFFDESGNSGTGTWSLAIDPLTDWRIQDFEVIDAGNRLFYFYISGYRQNTPSIGWNVNNNYSIFWTKAWLNSGFSGLYYSQDIWRIPVSIVNSTSTAAQNISTFVSPTVSFDGTYYWLIFNAEEVTGETQEGAINTQNIIYFSKSVDMENWTYPAILTGNSGDIIASSANLHEREYWVVNANYGDYYFLLGTFMVNVGISQIYQFAQNNYIADLTGDILKYEIDETAGSASQVTLSIANQSGQWYGLSPTKTGYQALLAANNQILISQGFIDANGNQVVAPKDIYYLDNVNQTMSATQNELTITGRNLYKPLMTISSKYSYTYSGTDRYVDVFGYPNATGSTLSNWNQSTGTWQEVNGFLEPSAVPSGATEDLAVLTSITIENFNYTFSVGLICPTVSGEEAHIYAYYANSSNWLRLVIGNNGSAHTWIIQKNLNGGESNQGSGTFFLFYSEIMVFGIVSNTGYVSGTEYITASFSYSPIFSPTGSSSDFFSMPALFGYSTLCPAGGGNPVITDISYYTISDYGVNWNANCFALGCVEYQAQFANLKIFQPQNHLDIQNMTKDICTKGGIFNYNFPLSYIDTFNYGTAPSLWLLSGTGSLSFPKNIMTITAANNPILISGNSTFTNFSVEFEASFTGKYGFSFVFCGTGVVSIFTGYTFDIGVNSSNNVYASFSCWNEDIRMQQMTSTVDANQILLGSLSNLNINLTEYHKYKIIFNSGYMEAIIDDVTILMYQDNGNTGSAPTFTSGNIGFMGISGISHNLNGTLLVRYIKMPELWSEVFSFGISPGDDLNSNMQNLTSMVNAWYYSDNIGNLNLKILNPDDPVTYNYESQIITQDVTNSNSEPINQVVVIGQGVSATAQNTASIQQYNGIINSNTTTNYTIINYDDALTLANQLLLNANQLTQQLNPTQTNNIGSTLFDVISITNARAGVSNAVVRVYNQTTTLDGSSRAYTIQIGTGAVTLN